MTNPRDAVKAAAARSGRRRAGVVVGALVDDERAYGAAGTRVVPTADDLFEIGSISKVFTALVLADLVVRGDLRLDQPVRELLPGVPVPSHGGTEITLEHLATHRGGLPRSPRLGPRGYVRHLRGRDPYDATTPNALLDDLGRVRLRRRPGTGGASYSNLGVALLGIALVRFTGVVDYESLVVPRVCEPLGMSATRVGAPAESVLVGHRGSRQVDRWRLTGLAGAGGLVSSATDLLTFLAAQLDPAGTPLETAIRLTQQPRGDARGGVGLGWMRASTPHELWWHNGGTGGYRSFAGFIPDRHVAVVVLSNQARTVDLAALRLLRELAPSA